MESRRPGSERRLQTHRFSAIKRASGGAIAFIGHHRHSVEILLDPLKDSGVVPIVAAIDSPTSILKQVETPKDTSTGALATSCTTGFAWHGLSVCVGKKRHKHKGG